MWMSKNHQSLIYMWKDNVLPPHFKTSLVLVISLYSVVMDFMYHMLM